MSTTVKTETNGKGAAEQMQTAPRPDAYDDEPKGMGMLIFAVTMMMLAGIWAVFEGIAAIANSKVYTANATFVFSDLKTWGWIVLVLGALLILSSLTVLAGSQFGRWFGIFAAGIYAMGQLFFVQPYPFWSLCMFAASIVIIWALAAHAGPQLKR